MGISYIAYAAAALVVAIFLAVRTDRKFLAFVLTFWLLAQPILEYSFTLHWLGFDLTPNRMLLLILFGYHFVPIATGRKGAKNTASSATRVPFERYLYIYLVIVIVSLAVNLGKIRPQDIIVVPLQIVTFILVYLTTKKFMTRKVLEAVIMSIIILTVAGAVIAYVQFSIDGAFLRTRDIRTAFGDITRSTGIFPQEYDFGAIQIVGVMTTIFRFRGSFLVYLLVPVLALSVVLTFHRLDIIILAMCLIIYFLFYTNARRKAFIVFALVAMSAAYPLIGSMLNRSEVVTTLEGRIGQNTVTGRLAQYQVLAEQIFTDYTLLGMGTYENPAYNNLMIKNGMISAIKDGVQVGFRAHNGYLEVGILNGLIAMFMFTLFLVSMLWYFKKRSYSNSQYSALPVFVVLIYMLINVSNGISSFAFYIALLCAMLTGSFVMYHRWNVQETKGAQRNVESVDRILGAKTSRSAKHTVGIPHRHY